MTSSRRQFIQTLAATGAAVALAPRSARAADAHIEVLLDEPIGTIAPELYGHFAEHLGGVVYDGIWVGEASKIANDFGIRRALTEKLKRSRRRSSAGPVAASPTATTGATASAVAIQRPTRTNFWASITKVPPSVREVRAQPFGTIEFARFCQLVRCAAVHRREPPRPAGARFLSLGRVLQLADGHDQPGGNRSGRRARPYNVVFWGVGNESWGCGGDFTPEDYADRVAAVTRPGCRRYGVKLALHRSRRQQRRRRLDAALLRASSTARTSPAWRGALGLLVPPLRVERQQRPHD